MNKLEAIKNELRKMAKQCKKISCRECDYKEKCYKNLGRYMPDQYLTFIQKCENLLND